MSFFDVFGRPDKDELRYEVDYEDAHAQALSALLRRVDPTHDYELTKVENRTPRFLSIFIKDGFN